MIKIIRNTGICLLCWLALSTTVQAQKKLDADALFLKARDVAFSENWAEARKICRQLLTYYPEYYDAIMLIGRTYAWELKTDSARMVVSPLLDIEPDNYDVLTLLTDNEIWGGRYDQALEFINLALDYYPSDDGFLYKKASVYYQKKDNPGAIKALYELLTIDPDHIGGNELLNNILPPRKYIDEMYAKAEEENRAGNWKLARRYCRRVLAEDPNYFEAELLMAQTFAFETKFDSARIVSTILSETHPRNYDLLELMVDIEIWNRKYKAALVQVGDALSVYPNDENFLFKKAKIQYLSKDYKDALNTLDELLTINPDHEEGNALKKLILENHRYRDYVFLEEYFETFEKQSCQKLITSAGLSKWTKYGTYIAKLNEGEHFPRDGVFESPAFQFELEAYQTLSQINYLWLNYAWSPYNFFPDHRGGIEFFQRLPKGFEVSLGLRFLYWNPDFTWIYTGSISWMKDRNYLAFRPFFCRINKTWSDTYILTYRRYLSDKLNDYAYAMVGYGNYSDDFMQLNPELNTSYMTQIGILKSITVRWAVSGSAGYACDMDKTSKKGYWNRFQASAGVRYYFNMFQ